MYAGINSRMIARCIKLGITCIILTGCAVLDTHQAKLDQKQLREVLMDYNEEQILDNLIRAYHGRAIVHFDVKTVTATVASKVTPSAGYGRTSVSNQLPESATETTTTTGATGDVLGTVVRTTVGAASAFVGVVTKPFTSNVSAERTNNVFVDVKPLDERKIYAAYIKFLNTGFETAAEDKKRAARPFETTKITTTVVKTTVEPEQHTSPTPTLPPEESPSATPSDAEEKLQETISTTTEQVPTKPYDVGDDLIIKHHPSHPRSNLRPLMSGSSRPRPNQVLVGPKCWNNCYYWVPVEYRKAFFELCLATVTKGASPASRAEGTKTEIQKQSEELLEEFEDLNSLQRLRQTTPP